MVSQPEDFPFMVIGNKLDLEEESRAINAATAQEWCDKNGQIDFRETSASKNQNVEEAFIQLARKALKRQAEMNLKLEESAQGSRASEREKNKLKLGNSKAKRDTNEGCQC